MSSGAGYRGEEGPTLADADAAAERADEIMEGLSALIDADDPGILHALRAGQAELQHLTARFAGEYWLLPVLFHYRGAVYQELWRRLGDPADLGTAFDLLLRAVESTATPYEAVVFTLLTAAWDCHTQAPSPRARDAFISWGTLMLARLTADPGTPPGDEDVPLLRWQLALMLCDRAEAGDGDRLVDLDRACELLILAVESVPEPDPQVVSDLVDAAMERHQQAPSPRVRDTFITWATWLLGQPSARPGQPDGLFTDDYLTSLNMQVGCMLNERADAAAGQPGPGGARRLADLAAAIGHYEAVLAARPAGLPERAEFLAYTVHAYWDLMAAGGTRDELIDRMTGHAREAWTAPGLPEEARPLVGLYLGLGLLEQVSRPGTLPDIALIDLGASALSEVLPDLSEGPDHDLLAEAALGVLLVDKGQLAGDAASLAAAEPHLQRAMSAFNTVPADDPARPVVVRWLAGAEAALTASGFRVKHSDLAIELLRMDAENPDADAEQAATADMNLGTVLHAQAARQRGPDADAGIGYMRTAFEKAPGGSALRLVIARNLCGALVHRFFITGNRQDLQAARYYLERLQEDASKSLSEAVANLTTDADVILAALRGQIGLAYGAIDRDRATIRECVEHLREAVRLAGPRHPRAGALRSDLGLAFLLCFGYAGEDPADLREGIAELEAAAALIPAGHVMYDLARFRVATGLFLLGAMVRKDPDVLREVITRVREIRADWSGGGVDPLRVTAMLAFTHEQLWGLTGDPADLAAARECYATATAEFDQRPGHTQHGLLLISLARLERQAGNGRAAVRAGLAALRARARDVLLQAGPAHGLATARVAAAEASEVAKWCLTDEPALTSGAALAVEALELGRGLVLHAATSAADLPELLDETGRADLAGKWRRLDGQGATDEPWDGSGRGQWASLLGGASLEVPSDLRERTLAALDVGELVAPPTGRKIAEALSRTGSDALVYLLPPDGGAHGYAVLVPTSGGEPRAVPLPELRQETWAPLDEFTAAQARLLANPAAGEYGGLTDPDDGPQPVDREAAEDEWQARLEPLCDWAWTAVIGPLLEQAPRAAPDALPRLVLVPTGRLGVVPWHAARRPDAESGSGWRYAVADAVFSYAASGRQLVEVSSRPALPLAGAAVIAAPKNDLPSGPAEAAAIRGLYPGVRCLGAAFAGREDGTATPAAVLGALPARAGAGASLLHLVCHGMATSAGADASCLELEDDGRSPGAEDADLLTVKAILRQAGGRAAGAPGGIVTLAACRTDLTAADHDEALTLSTAFLAAGAVTVVGARWDLRDALSPALMYMFHHYLAAEGRRPGDALRAAQLWMLDPDREWPASMPPDLRLEFGLEHVPAWAGLTHQGQ